VGIMCFGGPITVTQRPLMWQIGRTHSAR
jgi:hypothetical protein